MRILWTIGALALTASPAAAARLYLSSGVSVFEHGQVSDYTGKPSLHEERFGQDKAGNCVQQSASTFSFVNGLNEFGADLTTGVHPGLALPPGSSNASLAAGVPVVDTSCYLADPSIASSNSVQDQQLDIAPGATQPTLYFGFYWGTIDAYNYITLLSKSGTIINVPGLTTNNVITGASLLSYFGKAGGYVSYIGFQFTALENFGSIIFSTNDRAFEITNVAYSPIDYLVNPHAGSLPGPQGAAAHRASAPGAVRALAVPEPTVAGLFAVAVGSLALARRRRADA